MVWRRVLRRFAKIAKAKIMANRTVKFLKSPTGHLNLAYNPGEEGEFEEKQAAELVELGFAEYAKKGKAAKDAANADAPEE